MVSTEFFSPFTSTWKFFRVIFGDPRLLKLPLDFLKCTRQWYTWFVWWKHNVGVLFCILKSFTLAFVSSVKFCEIPIELKLHITLVTDTSLHTHAQTHTHKRYVICIQEQTIWSQSTGTGKADWNSSAPSGRVTTYVGLLTSNWWLGQHCCETLLVQTSMNTRPVRQKRNVSLACLCPLFPLKVCPSLST